VTGAPPAGAPDRGGVDWTRVAIRAGFVVLALAAIGWDLPSSFGWENDGVAPRDLFAGVADNLRPGSAFRYPLLHPLLLGLLSLPVLLPAALCARSLHLVDLQPAILATPVMTACAVIARLVAIAGTVVALAALGRITTRLAGRRAALWAEAFAAVNVSVAYYGRATNLDGPALMWTALAVERLVRAGDGGDRRDLAAFAIFAAASVATKDQAYATYVLLLPAWLLAMVWAARRWRWADAARAGGLAALTYGLASGAFFNPSGFRARLRALGGPASGDYRAYAGSARGVAANLRDLWVAQADFWWPWPIVAVAWAGVALALALALSGRQRGADVGAMVAAGGTDNARLAPLLAGLGSLVGFTLVVGRAEHRFVLPLGFWLSFYVGLALDRAQRWDVARAALVGGASGGRLVPRLVTAAGGLLLASGLFASVELVVTQWADGRRAVERWLATRPPGTSVETYGPLVYLPRFAASPAPPPYQVARVGPEPIAGRNPQAGMVELQARIADAPARHPAILILTEGFASAYLEEPARGGRVLPRVTSRARDDQGATAFVRAAVADALPGYRLCLVARPHLPWPFRVRRIHGSTGTRTWVLERTELAAPGWGVQLSLHCDNAGPRTPTRPAEPSTSASP
jgi:hypothetical protein